MAAAPARARPAEVAGLQVPIAVTERRQLELMIKTWTAHPTGSHSGSRTRTYLLGGG